MCRDERGELCTGLIELHLFPEVDLDAGELFKIGDCLLTA
jgi:hypothetical protein